MLFARTRLSLAGRFIRYFLWTLSLQLCCWPTIRSTLGALAQVGAAKAQAKEQQVDGEPTGRNPSNGRRSLILCTWCMYLSRSNRNSSLSPIRQHELITSRRQEKRRRGAHSCEDYANYANSFFNLSCDWFVCRQSRLTNQLSE